jgi:hypothetical protein
MNRREQSLTSREVAMHHRNSRISLRTLYSGIVGVTLAVSFLWAGCSGCQSPPTVNVPASNLDVNFAVSDVTETPSDGKVIVVMQFLQNGSLVQPGSGATASCNGVALTYNALFSGNAGRVPLLPTGGVYAFSYTMSGVSTNVSITAPPRPVFSPPTVAGAALTRTNNFTIFYVAGTGTSVMGDASDGTHSQNNTQPDNGTFVGLDVSGFNAGAGTLSIQRALQNPISGTGFHSATEKYFINKSVAVTWQ